MIDPLGLSKAYVARFEELGGKLALGDAGTLAQDGAEWRVTLADGTTARARDVVVALGPWADVLSRRLGYNLPLAVKRGYHMHYKAQGNAVLNHPVLDTERGYFLAPMQQGIRLTTGAEFADRDAPKTPVQLERAEPIARTLFPLGERIDPEPWLGRRPCTPDMMPIIGPAPKHKGLWFSFGHAHHGLTLAAVTGRMIAEMVTARRSSSIRRRLPRRVSPEACPQLTSGIGSICTSASPRTGESDAQRAGDAGARGEDRDRVMPARPLGRDLGPQQLPDAPCDRRCRVDPLHRPGRDAPHRLQQQRVMRAGERHHIGAAPSFSTKQGAISAAMASSSTRSPFKAASARPASPVAPTSVTSQPPA